MNILSVVIYLLSANQPPTIKTPTPVPDRPSSRPKSGRLSSSLRHHEIDDKRTVARSPTFVSERTYTAFARGKRPSTSRTLTSVQSSNYKDGKISQNGVRTSFKMDKHITEALPAMEPAFLEVTKEIAGQYVWRLEVIYIFRNKSSHFPSSLEFRFIKVRQYWERSLVYTSRKKPK